MTDSIIEKLFMSIGNAENLKKSLFGFGVKANQSKLIKKRKLRR